MLNPRRYFPVNGATTRAKRVEVVAQRRKLPCWPAHTEAIRYAVGIPAAECSKTYSYWNCSVTNRTARQAKPPKIPTAPSQKQSLANLSGMGRWLLVVG